MTDFKFNRNFLFTDTEHDIYIQHNGFASLMKLSIDNNHPQVDLLTFNASDFLNSIKGVQLNMSSNGIQIIDKHDGHGLVGQDDFSQNYTDKSYVQRKFVEDYVNQSITSDFRTAIYTGGGNSIAESVAINTGSTAFELWGNTGSWIGTNHSSHSTVFTEANAVSSHDALLVSRDSIIEFNYNGLLRGNQANYKIAMYKINKNAADKTRPNWIEMDYFNLSNTTNENVSITLMGAASADDLIFISAKDGTVTRGAFFRVTMKSFVV